MSTKTNYLGLFKYDPTADGKKKFNITSALNNNFDKLDQVISDIASKAGIPPSNCKNMRISQDGTTISLNWKDPSDTVIDDQTLCTWAKTIIVRKEGSSPENESDGDIILVNTVRNAYDTASFVDEVPDADKEYYYGAFPVSKNGVVNLNTSNQFGSAEVYELVIEKNNANPKGMITYPEGCINEKYTPAGMDYTTGSFNYGSFKNAFFMDLFKPCMLKYDGTVDYYLDPNDYSKKLDGTASDVSNTAYAGNAMVEVGQIWIKEENINGKKHIYIANKQVDDDYDCFTHLRKDGAYNKFYYRGLFDGCNISNKIRSIAGQNMCKNVAGDTQIAYAKANGSGWNVDEYNFRRLINYLLLLIGKSTDTQTVFGTGRYTGYTNSSNTGQIDTTGTLKDKGMFYGDNNNGLVKVFHMENWWGNIWKITQGCIQKNGKLLYKMCEGTGDGSTTENYNTTGDGYIDSGVTLPGTISEQYIKNMELVPHLGLIPTSDSGGSSSTYFCDGMWSNNTVVGFARFGCHPADGFLTGCFALVLNAAGSVSNWNSGVSLSYKPL